MRRRAFLRTGVTATLSAVLPAVHPGMASATTRSSRESGIVWSQRDSQSGTGRLVDIARRGGGSFVVCGYDTDDEYERSVVRFTDQWGRQESQRRGPEWGDRAYELVARDDGFLLAGVDDGAPTLVRFADLSTRAWTRTYDGTPDGTVHATTTGGGHAVGWTRAEESTGVVVIGTDLDGAEQWSDRPGDDRSLTDLVTRGTDPASLVAVGTRSSDVVGGWATVWNPDGTRDRDLTLDTPGDGPAAAVADGDAVVLGGTTDEGWWLQRRTSEWAVDWTQTHPGNGTARSVSDLVARTDGYGLLGHDGDGTVLVRTDGRGEERWRGTYTHTDGDDPADRGHAMVPVDGDEFVIAGTAAPGEDGGDWWTARVGEPGVATPADVPEPTPTPTPHDPLTPTPSPSGGATPTAGGTSDRTPGADGTGFGLIAALSGLVGWLAVRRRDG